MSLASTQSTLLSQQVYLTDKIDNSKRERMPHLKCVCFLRPTEDSLMAMERELREPKYGEYYLCQSVNSRYTLPKKFISHTVSRLQQYTDQDGHRKASRSG